MRRIPAILKAELDATGLPYQMRQSKRHVQIRLNGRMVGVISLGAKGARGPDAYLNIVAAIRRAAKEMTQ